MPTNFSAHPQIKVDNLALPDALVPLLASVEIDEQLSVPAMCTIRMRNRGHDVLTRSGAKIGASIDVAVLPLERAVPEELFTGEVVAIEADYESSGSFAVIRAYDVSHRLHRSRHTKVFEKMKDSDVVRDVAGAARVPVGTVDATTEVHAQLLQSNETDWDFLLRRAFSTGFDVRVEKGKVSFTKPRAAGEAPSVGSLDSTDPVQLAVGANLTEFHPRLTSAEQVASVEVRGWDGAQKRVIAATAAATSDAYKLTNNPAGLAKGFGGPTRVVDGTTVSTENEAGNLAKAIAAEVGGASVDATGMVSGGDPRLRAGSPVSVGLVDKEFEGKYMITSACHSFDDSGYRTHIEMTGREPRSVLALAPSQRSTRPQTRPGVVTAIVTDLKDPDQLGRVKVSFPWLDAKSAIWARAVHTGAGASRGFTVLPELDDEVLVAFEHGDTNRPIVLGGLYNKGVDKPPNDAWSGYLDGGKVIRRSWVSRAGHRVTLVDPPGNANDGRIEISFSDDSAQIVVERDTVRITTKDRVEISADKTIELKAREIKLEAQQTLTLKSSSQVNVEAGSKLSAKSNGPAEIKGTPIQLN